MAIIIDGYNLLHASGILPSGKGPGTLQRSRQALLNFLVESLPPEELARTTIVFDASEAPWGVARKQDFQGLTIWFAPKDGDADTLIEEMILEDSAPKRLTIVSSDHRLHRAAKRRKATPIDSDKWFVEVSRRRREGVSAATPTQEVRKPEGPFSPAEVDFWLEKFAPPPETAPKRRRPAP